MPVSPLRGEWIEMQLLAQLADSAEVSPLRGEWIEIFGFMRSRCKALVSPLRGEWIEIGSAPVNSKAEACLASQRRVD